MVLDNISLMISMAIEISRSGLTVIGYECETWPWYCMATLFCYQVQVQVPEPNVSFCPFSWILGDSKDVTIMIYQLTMSHFGKSSIRDSSSAVFALGGSGIIASVADTLLAPVESPFFFLGSRSSISFLTDFRKVPFSSRSSVMILSCIKNIHHIVHHIFCTAQVFWGHPVEQ